MQVDFSKEALFISRKTTKQNRKQGQKPQFLEWKEVKLVIAPRLHRNGDASHLTHSGGAMHTGLQ